MFSPPNVLIRNNAPTTGAATVDHQDGATKKAAISDHGAVTRLGDAREQTHHQCGVRFVHTGIDQPYRFGMGISVAPDENVISTRPSQSDRITCPGLTGLSRYEQRRNYCNSHPAPPRHLGTIEGEKLRHSSDYDESYTLVQAMLSLLAVTFAVIGTGMALYGMMGG